MQGDAVDGGEHQRHEEADAYQRVESCHAHDADGSQRTDSCPAPEDGQQFATVHILHQQRGDEAATEEQSHCRDVVHLCRSLVHAQVVGIVDDECPHHDLCVAQHEFRHGEL